MHSRRILLFHAYHTFIPATDIPVSTGRENRKIEEEINRTLETWADQLKGQVNPGTEIAVRTEDAVLATVVNELCRQEKIDMIIMGVTGKSVLRETFIGSKAIQVLDISECPVLLVPPETAVAPVENVIFATDLKKVSATTPLQELESLLHDIPAHLWVLNVEHPDERYSPQLREELTDLHTLLQQYDPEYRFSIHEDIVQGIITFAEERSCPLVIVVPRKHGLFHSSITRKLVRRLHVPVIAIPERKYSPTQVG